MVGESLLVKGIKGLPCNVYAYVVMGIVLDIECLLRRVCGYLSDLVLKSMECRVGT